MKEKINPADLKLVKKESLFDIYGICLGAYLNGMHVKSTLDAVFETQDFNMNVLEKMKHIEETTEAADTALVSLIPNVVTSYGERSYVQPKVNPLKLKELLAKAIVPYMEHVGKQHTREQNADLFEFHTMHSLSEKLMRMAYIVVFEQISNPEYAMQCLLEIADTMIDRCAELWSHFKDEAAEITHNLPLDNILHEVCKDDNKDLKAAAEKMFPDVVAECLLYCSKKGCYPLCLEYFNNIGSRGHENDDYGYKRALDCLVRGSLFDKEKSLKEQLWSIDVEIAIAVSEAILENDDYYFDFEDDF